MNEFTSPAVQAMNLIRYIGDQVSESGKPIPHLDGISQEIGAPSKELANQLIKELHEHDLIIMGEPSKETLGPRLPNVNLTLTGWKQYEAEKRGEFDGNYGFIAMQFNDPALESFVRDVVKPAVKEDIGYDLVDMRDVSKAGIIDNIMRVQIRDAKFVIADLTHGNNGAYWEAGYAEGLGKPVIYICEKEKFESKNGTHFDTNHCTTVVWSKSRDKDEGFRQELTATLRRSLDES
ncbi:MAG: hypothetical protein F4Y91_12335 [Gemmatimonadetes bacterium]|nr:hypothetical protein [Gemmatimonadota bacterium]